jgi:uncharacterized protein YecE (DUF72 family)
MENHIPSSSFYSGISGLQLNIPKYRFPEEFQHSSRLTYYASLFNSIEINSSFYKIPQAKTLARWANEVPADFRFTFKLYREITHSKEHHIDPSVVREFIHSIDSVYPKSGCILVQFPPGMGNEYFRKLEVLLSEIQELNKNWKVAVEFRNKVWYQDKTYHLLNDMKACLVLQDMPKSATPLVDHTQDFMYVRFHGPTGNYRDSYPGHFLEEYATYIKEWMQEGKIVYIYFNNTAGDAVNNCISLNSKLQLQQADINPER